MIETAFIDITNYWKPLNRRRNWYVLGKKKILKQEKALRTKIYEEYIRTGYKIFNREQDGE